MVRKNKHISDECDSRYYKRLAVSVDTLLRRALNWNPNPRYQTVYSDPLPIDQASTLKALEELARGKVPDRVTANLHGDAELVTDPRQQREKKQ